MTNYQPFISLYFYTALHTQNEVEHFERDGHLMDGTLVIGMTILLIVILVLALLVCRLTPGDRNTTFFGKAQRADEIAIVQ